MSRADEVFIQNCRDILDNGFWDTDLDVRPRWEDGAPAHTVKRFGVVNRYDLAEEFPILTIRRTFWKSAVDELLWIWQKKSNNVHELRSRVWDAWADENGSIGKAYGYQLGVKYTLPRGRVRPGRPRALRPQAQPRLPAHTDKPLQLRRPQRDGALPLRVLHDLQRQREHAQRHTQPAQPGHAHGEQLERLPVRRARAHVRARAGLRPGELVHVIADAHIYDRHVPTVERILDNPRYPAPQLELDPGVTDFYAFTRDSFSLPGYRYTELDEKIPVAL